MAGNYDKSTCQAGDGAILDYHDHRTVRSF